ncbi:MAG: hypothetical protein ACRDT2_05345 [Natronosporangium sp.]
MPGSDPRSVRELLAALAGTPVGAELSDPDRQLQRFYRQLAEHNDPLLREIGIQLRDGLIRPRQMLEVPVYDAVVAELLERWRQVDPELVHRELAEQVDANERDEP